MNKLAILLFGLISVFCATSNNVNANSMEEDILEWCLANKEELPDVIRYNLTIENIRETKFLQPDSISIETIEDGKIKNIDVQRSPKDADLNKDSGVQLAKNKMKVTGIAKEIALIGKALWDVILVNTPVQNISYDYAGK